MQRRVLTLALCALSIALVPGCGALKRWGYAGSGRDSWQQPERVIASLGLEASEHVADLGAGGGYFTFRLAEAVGADGVVYAVDVDEDMTGYLEERVRDAGHGNVKVILAKYDDPSLPLGDVDLIFTCNTYHHVEGRTQYFANARKYLRPEGRIAIVEYREGSWLSGLFGYHATPLETIRAEMEAAGYRLETEHEFLSRQSFLVFVAGS